MVVNTSASLSRWSGLKPLAVDTNHGQFWSHHIALVHLVIPMSALYLTVDSNGYMWTKIIYAKNAAWLNISYRSEVCNVMSCYGVKGKYCCGAVHWLPSYIYVIRTYLFI